MGIDTASKRLSICVMVSGAGRGTNLQSLQDACDHDKIDGCIRLVIGTRSDAPALRRTAECGIQTGVVSPKKYADDDEAYADALFKLLERQPIDLICLSGYMRRLPHKVVTAYPNRIMNIHPALLPLFGGKGMFGEHVHAAAIESGMKISGCTVHFVDDQYDTGPIILQTPVPILDDDTPSSLAARVLIEEHRTYAQAVQLFARGKLQIEGRRVRILPE